MEAGEALFVMKNPVVKTYGASPVVCLALEQGYVTENKLLSRHDEQIDHLCTALRNT